MRDNKSYKELGYQTLAEYGEKELGYERTRISQFIKVAIEYKGNVDTYQHLGFSKLLALTKLEPEERENFIQNTDVENTTVRELERQIKELKNVESENTRLSLELNKKIKKGLTIKY